MADTVLKFANPKKAAAEKASALKGFARKRLRLILLVIVPALVAAVGLGFYLAGGRYISTDNSYIGAQKVLVTPDVSGRINRVAVKEGQRVEAGDVLFEIDPVPFRLAVEQAQGKLDAVRVDFAKLKDNLQSLDKLVELANQNADIKQRDVQRKSTLVSTNAGSAADLDSAKAALVAAQLQAQYAAQQRNDVLHQLKGDRDLPIEQFPPYLQAKAALDQAQRDLAHAVLKAPIAGTATQVDNIQLGRFVTAGSPVLSVIDDAHPWVDANPKETDVTHLRLGEKVTVTVDAFPDRIFHGHVAAVSPGTGSQFAILPPQNASGNWVKVVQRLPVRIAFDEGENVSLLRAGMSATVDIDTGRHHTLASLLGFGTSAQAAP
ncbi:MAG TPA: HlyD family secretion protein [Xanthobacteraceae bacterium]|nr:HlyD family secretion protein [Xanthobacteraceae bacterium]